MALFPFHSIPSVDMRYLLSVLLTLTLLGAGSLHAQIQKKVSDITGATRLVSQDMRSLVAPKYPGHASFRAEYENPPKQDSVWRLSFFGFAQDTTEMSAATDVQMVADGKTISPSNVVSKTRKLDNSILEIKHAAFTRSAFQDLATANKVRATIGPAQFKLTHPLRKDLRLILERVPKGKGPQTASTDESESRR